MIHSNKHIIYFLAGCLSLLASCTDEEMIDKEVKVEEGIPVTTTLSFGASDIVKIETKATDIDKDNKVNSLAIFVFNKKKEKVGKTHFITSLADEKVTIQTSSGKRYVYAVANYKSSLFDLKSQLEGITTLDGLKNLSVELPDNNISVLDGQFLMSGWFVGNTKEEGFCIIGADGQILNANNPDDDPAIGKIDLKRIMSSIKFKIVSTTSGATFVANSWQVKKLPKHSYLIEQENRDYQGGDDDYFASGVNSGIQLAGDTSTFSFLMMENRKLPVNLIKSNTPNEAINEREKMDRKNENFINANPKSTYVVIEGTYKGKTSIEVNGDGKNNEKNVTATTTYYIHLGDWRGNDYSNFNIFRNNRYTYTVKVISVDKIIVEVESDEPKDESWSSDGEIYMTNNHVSDFDAHYGTTVISFSKGTIQNLINRYPTLDDFKKNFEIVGATPLNNFKFDSVSENLDWVTYKRNLPGSDDFMEYKGGRDKDPSLLNADGLKTDLFDSCNNNEGFDSNDVIRYTCFIDEYYYKDLPLDKFVNQRPRSINILTYYKFNTETSSNSSINMSAYTFVQRPIYTIYNLDKDVNGWGTESIQETANLSSEDVEAYYSKDVDENKDYREKNGKNNFNQGIINIWHLLSGREFWPIDTGDYNRWLTEYNNKADNAKFKWSDYIEGSDNSLKNTYAKAEYACLTRNRDLNGNGVIDPDELRWYLPAITQYMGLVIGEDVLPKETRLYNQSDGQDRSKYIYASSSTYPVQRQKGLYYVLSASEGLTLAFQNYENDYNPNPTVDLLNPDISVPRELPYRCIRNLRNVTAQADDYVTPGGTESDKDYMYEYYSFDNLNPKAKRNNVIAPLTTGHNLFDEENRVPNSFEISERYEVGTATAESLALNDPCTTQKGIGWRLPNQRELAVFIFHKGGGAGDFVVAANYFSCTKGISDNSYCGYYSAGISNPSMVIWKDTQDGQTKYDVPYIGVHYDNDGYYRCVKDK